MRILILTLLLFVPHVVFAQWTEYGSFYGNPNYSQELLNGVFFADAPADTPTSYTTPGAWHTVSLLKSTANPKGIPAWSTAVSLGGIMIITGGPQNTIYNLTIAFRKTGCTVNAPYTTQTCCVGVTTGSRAPAFVVVPVSNGCFDYNWQRSPAEGALPVWPGGPAFGANFAVSGFYGPAGQTP